MPEVIVDISRIIAQKATITLELKNPVTEEGVEEAVDEYIATEDVDWEDGESDSLTIDSWTKVDEDEEDNDDN